MRALITHKAGQRENGGRSAGWGVLGLGALTLLAVLVLSACTGSESATRVATPAQAAEEESESETESELGDDGGHTHDDGTEHTHDDEGVEESDAGFNVPGGDTSATVELAVTTTTVVESTGGVGVVSESDIDLSALDSEAIAALDAEFLLQISGEEIVELGHETMVLLLARMGQFGINPWSGVKSQEPNYHKTDFHQHPVSGDVIEHEHRYIGGVASHYHTDVGVVYVTAYGEEFTEGDLLDLGGLRSQDSVGKWMCPEVDENGNSSGRCQILASVGGPSPDDPYPSTLTISGTGETWKCPYISREGKTTEQYINALEAKTLDPRGSGCIRA